MIDSNKTQLNSDYDYSMLRKWALGNKGGLLKKSDFIFDKSKGELSAGSEIAEAVILCKRPTSYPIQNQTFLAQFQFTGKLENLQTVEGTKIYIEIKENLIMDPTLIADQPGSTNFAKGFDIGEIKATPERPSHENYLKLYEISNGEVVDHRKEISLPALDSVSQRTTTLEEKVSQAEEKVGKLEEAGTPDHLWIKAIVAEAFKENDEAYEYHLPLASEVVSDCPIWKTNQTKEIHIPRVSTGVSFNTLEVYLKKVWEPSQNLVVEIRKAKKVTASGMEYVMGGDLLASGTVPHAEITTAYQMKTVILNKSITVTKDEFVIIVLKQQNETVNASNYFCIGVSKNPSLGYGVICVEAEGKYNKTYANVVCNSQWWYSNGIFGLSGSGSSGEKKRTLPDRYNFANGFPKNAITEIVAPADELTVKIKVKCSNWKNSGYGNTGWGFHVKLWSQILTTYSYSATAEISKTVVISTKLLEKLELYIQGDSVNYSTFYTGCDVDISWEISVKPWELLARTLYCRKTVAIGEKWEFTIFGYHTNRTWIWAKKINTGAFKIVTSWNKSGNSSNTIKIINKETAMFLIEVWVLSWDQYSIVNPASWSVEILVNNESYLTVGVNGSKTSNTGSLILPEGEIAIKLTTQNNEGRRVEMPYSIRRQS